MKNNFPLVSIVIPTYNGSKRIAKTLEAIINQDYENIEIILVDDVSTDDTVKVSRKVLEKSKRKFLIIQRTTNGRQSASRNTGLKAANGKYVIFVDHDDLVETNYVSLLCNEAEKKNADLVFCGFKHYYVDENRYEYNYVLKKYPISSSSGYLKAWAKNEITFNCVWFFIFNRSFLEDKKLRFNEKCYICEDLEFIPKALALSSCTSYVKATPYIYVHHSEQQSITDIVHRKNYKVYRQEVLAMWRAGRCVLKNSKDRYVKNFVLCFCITQRILRFCRLCIEANDHDYYDRITKTLHHKKIRRVMFSSLHFIFSEPEIFFKFLIIYYFPNFYYKVRSKNK